MRILILNPEFPPIGGGASNASAYIASHLVKLGVEVNLITARYEDMPWREEFKGIGIIRVPSIRRSKSKSGILEQLSYVIGGLWAALGHARVWKPDIVLAFFGVPSGLIAWPIKLFYGIPYVVLLRGGDVPGFRPYDFKNYHKMGAFVIRFIWRNAAAVVANSFGLRELGKKTDNKVEIKVIRNGVDCNDYFQSSLNGVHPTRLLAVGRIVRQKGIDITLNALSELRDLDWHFQIAGEGPHQEELEILASELNIADRVEFIGWCSKEDLPSIYQNAHVYVYPSRDEGMPNVVLEAMASGLPVVASNISGNEELVEVGKTGYLVPAEDSQQLSKVLRTLIPNYKLQRQLGNAGRIRVEESHKWEQVADEYFKLTHRILGIHN